MFSKILPRPKSYLEISGLIGVLATLIIDQPVVGCIASNPRTEHPSNCSNLPRGLHSILPLQRYICADWVWMPRIISQPCQACYTSKGSLSRTRSEHCRHHTGWPKRERCRAGHRIAYLFRGGVSRAGKIKVICRNPFFWNFLLTLPVHIGAPGYLVTNLVTKLVTNLVIH